MTQRDFEWDPQKDQANVRKHRLTFEYASRVWLDPLRTDETDDGPDYGEARRRTIGEVQGKMVLVIYTERDSVIRIISARRPNAHEKRNQQNG